MKKLLLFNLLLILSCSTDEAEEVITQDPIPKNEIELNINGGEIESNIINISAYYMCDKKLHVTITSKVNNVTSDLFKIILLKNGELLYSNFVDKNSSPTTNYSTADFIPSSTLTIEEFQFIENEKLNIKLSGNLLKPIYNLNDTPETIEINGEIRIKEFGISSCNTYNNFIKLNNEIEFFDISKAYQNTQPNLSIKYESNSVNGYNIQFKNFTEFLPDMDLGTYTFDNTSSLEKIEFKQYIGIPKVFSTDSDIIPSDWKKFETNGSFTIVEKLMINGHRVVKLKLNFTTSYNGIIEYTFTDAPFETVY